MTPCIWLARHGEREDTADPAWVRCASRPHDPGLSAAGLKQASELAYRLRHESIAHVFVSPFLRTVQTAHVVAEAINLSMKLEHGFCEWLNPAWFSEPPTFVPVPELVARYHRIEPSYASRLIPIFPETTRGITDRAGRAMRLVLPDHPGPILVVGHAATVMGVARALDPASPRLVCPFCSLTRLSRQNGAWRVDVADDTSFLSAGPQGACL